MANKLSLVLSGGIRKVMHNFPQQASLFEICHTNGCSTLLSDQHDRLAFFVIVSQKQSGGMLRNSLLQMNKCFILSIYRQRAVRAALSAYETSTCYLRVSKSWRVKDNGAIS